MRPSTAHVRMFGLIACLATVLGVGCKDDKSARRGDGRPAELKASPNPLPAGPGAGKTMLTWRIGDAGTAQVYVSVNGRPEKKVAEGHEGSKEIDWIHPGRDYKFKLYAGEDRKKVLATLAVRKNESPGAGARAASGQRSAGATGAAAQSGAAGATGSTTSGRTPAR